MAHEPFEQIGIQGLTTIFAIPMGVMLLETDFMVLVISRMLASNQTTSG